MQSSLVEQSGEKNVHDSRGNKFVQCNVSMDSVLGITGQRCNDDFTLVLTEFMSYFWSFKSQISVPIKRKPSKADD